MIRGRGSPAHLGPIEDRGSPTDPAGRTLPAEGHAAGSPARVMGTAQIVPNGHVGGGYPPLMGLWSFRTVPQAYRMLSAEAQSEPFLLGRKSNWSNAPLRGGEKEELLPYLFSTTALKHRPRCQSSK